MRDLLEADEAILVFGLAPPLNIPVPACAKAAIVAHAQGGTFDDLHKHVILIPSFPHELQVTGIFRIADSLQNHIIALFQSDVADVLHCLNERHYFAECLLCQILVVASYCVLVVYVVAGPDILCQHPSNEELG